MVVSAIYTLGSWDSTWAQLMNLSLLAVGLSGIAHLNERNFHNKTNETPFTLVYFYSSGCQFCKEFNPKF